MSQFLDDKKECPQDSSASYLDLTIPDDIDPVAEKRLLRKLDFALLPLFVLSYLANFVDRTAVGNARIAGLEKDLNLKGLEFNIGLTMFYIAYIVVEIPSNLALKHFGSIWLAVLIIAFGLVTLSSAFIHDFTGLVLTRILLGLAEGGLAPGFVYILSRYYRRKEFVLRMGVLLIAPTLAGAFGGLLASGLLSIHAIGSVTSWRKIFLVDGIITTGIGIICLFAIPADPEQSRLLTDKERVLALKRIAADSIVNSSKREKTSLSLILRAFNFNTLLVSLMILLNNISFQGLSLFMPTVITTLGDYTTVESELRTVPPYLLSAVCAITVSYLSLRTERRAIWIVLSVLLTVTGYAIFVGTENSHARYGACFLTIAGAGSAAPVMAAWAIDNAALATVRAVTTALISSIGSLGSVIAVWTYLPADGPDYHHGNSLNLAAASVICILTLVGLRYVHWENTKRDHGERDHRLVGKSQEEIEELGSQHPAYRYQS